MKNKISLLIVFLLNIFLSFFMIKLNSGILFYLVVDGFVWGLLYFLYEYLNKKKICFSYKLISNYILYYLVDLFLIFCLIIFFGIGILKAKCFGIMLILLLSSKLKDFTKYTPYILLLDLTLIFSLISPMSFVGNKNSGVDSSVFRYVGMMMTEGKIPYLDVFDHKGIFLYFINYLGFMVNKDVGIWIIEIINLYLTLIFGYKLARIFTNKFNSIIAVIVSFVPLICLFEGGNLTEEYALLFIILSLYKFTYDIIYKKYIRFSSSFIIGICLGAILMLRPNMIAVFCCMIIYVLIHYIKDKKIKELFKIILYFLLGIFVFCMPFLIYLIINDAIIDFFEQYLIFNFKYSSRDTTNNIFDVYKFFLNNCKYIYMVIVVYILSILKNNKYNNLMIYFIGCIILTFILIVMPKNLYAHYGMVILPTYIVAFAIMFEYLYSDGLKFISNNILRMIFIFLLVYAFVYSDLNVFKLKVDNSISKNENIAKIVEVIKNNTNKKDNVLVFGNQVNFYLKANRKTSSKYVYQMPIMNVDNRIKNNFKEEFINEKPKLIVVKNLDCDILLDNFSFIDDEYKKLDDDMLDYSIYLLDN